MDTKQPIAISAASPAVVPAAAATAATASAATAAAAPVPEMDEKQHAAAVAAWEKARLANECRLIVYNVAKKKNIGEMIRSCVAFGVTQIVIIGNRKFNTHGNQNTTNYIAFTHFDTIQAAMHQLKTVEGFRILGVEIKPQSRSVWSHPFGGGSGGGGSGTSKTALVLGNEGDGLNDKVMAYCDDLVYIPQHGFGTASLNVSVATAIMLHHFAAWAKYPETPRFGEKYRVDSNRKVSSGSGIGERVLTNNPGAPPTAVAAATAATDPNKPPHNKNFKRKTQPAAGAASATAVAAAAAGGGATGSPASTGAPTSTLNKKQRRRQRDNEAKAAAAAATAATPTDATAAAAAPAASTVASPVAGTK